MFQNQPRDGFMARFRPLHEMFDRAIDGLFLFIVVREEFLVDERPTAEQQSAVDEPDDAASSDE